MTLDAIRESIRAELEGLRAAGARRQELSLHACKRLFFDLGIRPSAASVRDLTQTGSASDIPKDIDHFWERIRSASKIRIEGTSLPNGLEEQAGSLLSAMYDAALQAANTHLDDERNRQLAELEQAKQAQHDTQVRLETLETALARSETRNETLQARLAEIHSLHATTATQGTLNQEALQGLVERLQTENTLLNQRLDAEQAQQLALRERLEGLQAELQVKTEHYAQQIKDAVAEAERRVKPMLVELDSLRGMAATYQSGLRDANRKEFDFLQQLSAAKVRADRLEVQVREQGDELAAAGARIENLRTGSRLPDAFTDWLQQAAVSGRLDAHTFAAIGTSLDPQVALPAHCPKCGDGEPELSAVGDGYELSCPDCEHTSGERLSRFEAVTRFMQS